MGIDEGAGVSNEGPGVGRDVEGSGEGPPDGAAEGTPVGTPVGVADEGRLVDGFGVDGSGVGIGVGLSCGTTTIRMSKATSALVGDDDGDDVVGVLELGNAEGQGVGTSVTKLGLGVAATANKKNMALKPNGPRFRESPTMEVVELISALVAPKMYVIAHLAIFIVLTMLSLGFEIRSTAIAVIVLCGACLLAPTSNEQVIRPRWERRWAKTEARRAKRKETRADRKREFIEQEARERLKRASLAAERRDRAAELRLEKEQARLDRKRAADAAEAARKHLDKQLEKDKAVKAAHRKRAKEEEDLASSLREMDALVAHAVALDALAARADNDARRALDELGEVPAKRRSNKSKANAKRSRDKAHDKKKIAETARDDALKAAARARAFHEKQQLARPLPSNLLEEAPLLETPLDVRRIVDEIRQTLAKHHHNKPLLSVAQ